MKNPIQFLRRTGWLEGISFLVLLGVAMPLKYFANMPVAVKVVGWIHGILFILYCAALLRATIVAQWPLNRAALFFVAGLLPFGTFLADRRLREYEAEHLARSS